MVDLDSAFGQQDRFWREPVTHKRTGGHSTLNMRRIHPTTLADCHRDSANATVPLSVRLVTWKDCLMLPKASEPQRRPRIACHRRYVATRQSHSTGPIAEAATSITRAHQVLVGRIDAALAPIPLNFGRFEVLALLDLTRKGQLPLGKIGDRLQVHPASVTNTVASVRELRIAAGDFRLGLVRG